MLMLRSGSALRVSKIIVLSLVQKAMCTQANHVGAIVLPLGLFVLLYN